MINYQLTVSGQVQGVGFRWGCYRLAQHYGVSGFVKNLPSGQVYLEVQGLPDAVTNYIAALKTGPPLMPASIKLASTASPARITGAGLQSAANSPHQLAFNAALS